MLEKAREGLLDTCAPLTTETKDDDAKLAALTAVTLLAEPKVKGDNNALLDLGKGDDLFVCWGAWQHVALVGCLKPECFPEKGGCARREIGVQ